MQEQDVDSMAHQVTERMTSLRDSVTGHLDREAVQERSEDVLKQVEQIPVSVYLLGVLGSIALSGALFLTGRRALALFVGLWPPTIIGLTQVKKLRPSQEFSHHAKAA